MTWSPLACGIVSGKYDGGIPPYSRASLKVSLTEGARAVARFLGEQEGQETQPRDAGGLLPAHGPSIPQNLHDTSTPQGYQWLKDKILSEEGRRQQAKLKELQAIAERLGCTLPQLAIGKGRRGETPGGPWGAARPHSGSALPPSCPSLVPAQ